MKLHELPLAVRLNLAVLLPVADCPCVYFLLDSAGEIVYIGAAVRPRQRIQFHTRHNWKAFADVKYLPTVRENLEHDERALIKLANPKYNRRGRNVHEWIDDGQWNGTENGTKGTVSAHYQIDSKLHSALLAHCRRNGYTIREALERAIAKWTGVMVPPRPKRGRPRKV